jgi:hypothetical protein
VELGLLHVLEHDALAALLLNHALVIGQIVCGSLDSVGAIPGADNFIDNSNRSRCTNFRIPVLGFNWQMVFYFLQVISECCQPGTLLLVPQVYVSFEGSFVAE